MIAANRAFAARRGVPQHSKRRAGTAFILFALGAAAYPLSIEVADPLLVARMTAVHADVIVVPGGDGPPRAEKAVMLWKAGIAHRIIVAGDGDCRDIRALLVNGGVPGTAIAMDCLSRDTWENALFSGPLLGADRARSAVLVTSLFHSGRALATFKTICPGIEWYSDPVEEVPVSGFDRYFGAYGQTVVTEYAKNLVYRLRIALFPPSPPPAGAACTQRRATKGA